MRIEITGYRRTKRGNWGFQTQFGEFFLDLSSSECRARFLRYFPHMRDRVQMMMERGFEPERLVGKYCDGYAVIEPLREVKE